MAYADEVLADSPVGYWPLDEGSGTTAADLSGNGNDGTLEGSGSSLSSASAAVGAGSYLDAGAGRVNVGTPQITTADFTIEAWVNMASSGSTESIFFEANDASSTEYVGLNVPSSGYARMNLRNGGAYELTGSTTLVNDSTWHHIVAVVEGSATSGTCTGKLYVDGQLEASGTLGARATYNNAMIGVLGRSTWTDYMNGSIDEVAVYQTALSPARISAHYLAGTGALTAYATEVLADSPVGYWPLDEASGSTAYDLSGNGIDATYYGTPSLASRSLNATLGDVANFDGTDDRVDTPVLGTTGWTAATIEAWTVMDTALGGASLVSEDFGGDGTVALAMGNGVSGSTTEFQAGRYSGSWAHADPSPTALSTATLHHCVATIDGTNIKLYVDGTLVSSAAGAWAGGNEGWRIGRRHDLSGTYNFWDGAIGHAAIYDTALTPGRIIVHYLAGAGALTDYAAEVLADAPALYWPFAESTDVSSVADWSGNDRTGTEVGDGGTELVTGATGIVAGGSAYAGDWTPGNAYMASNADANDTTLDVGTGDFAVEVWLKLANDTSSYPEIWSRDSGATGNGVLLYANITTGATRVWCGGTAGNGTQRITDDVLHHVVVTRRSGVVYVYIDGTLDNSFAAAGSTDVAGRPLRLGLVDNGYTGPDGQMGEFAYYTSGLTHQRVAAHYLAGEGLYYDDVVTAEPDVVAYWPLDEAAEPYLDRVASYDLSDGAGTPVPSSTATPVGTDSIDFTNANVTVTSNLGLTAYPFTFEAWVRQDAAGDGAAIHLGNDGGTNGVSWGHGNTTLDDTNNNIIALIDAVGWKSLSPTSLATDEWVHVCVVFGVSNVYVYKNGVLGTSVATSAMVTPSAEFYIGGYSTSSRYFNGKIGQVSVYDTEFTAGQAMLHYVAGLRGMAPADVGAEEIAFLAGIDLLATVAGTTGQTMQITAGTDVGVTVGATGVDYARIVAGATILRAAVTPQFRGNRRRIVIVDRAGAPVDQGFLASASPGSITWTPIDAEQWSFSMPVADPQLSAPYGGLPASPGFTDDFQRANSSTLGSDWADPDNAFGIDTGHLVCVDNGARYLATYDTGYAAHTLKMTITANIDGAFAPVVRYFDDDNYIYFTPSTGFGTWNVYKVVEGVTTYVTNLGLTGFTGYFEFVCDVQNISVYAGADEASKTLRQTVIVSVSNPKLLYGTGAGISHGAAALSAGTRYVDNVEITTVGGTESGHEPFREAQIWRGDRLLSFGPIITPSIDTEQATFQGAGAYWHLQNQAIGPLESPNRIGENGDFSDGLTGWSTMTDVYWLQLVRGISASRGRAFTQYDRNTATWWLQIDNNSPTSEWETGWYQPLVYRHYVLPSSDFERTVTFAAEALIPDWVYVGEGTEDTRGLMVGIGPNNWETSGYFTSLGQPSIRNMYSEGIAYDASDMDNDHPRDRWVEHEVTVTVPPGTWTVQVRFNSVRGSVLWRNPFLDFEDGLEFDDVDQADIIEGLVDHAQDPAYDRVDLNIDVANTPTGIVRSRRYPFAERTTVGDAIDEFATLINGAETYMDYTATTRTLRIGSPVQGRDTGLTFRWGSGRGNISDFAWSWDGTRAASAVVVIGTSAINREGSAIDPDAFAGGLILTEVLRAPLDLGNDSLDVYAQDRLRSSVRPTVLAVKMPADPWFGRIRLGDRVAANIRHGEFSLVTAADALRIVSLTLTEDDWLELVLNGWT